MKYTIGISEQQRATLEKAMALFNGPQPGNIDSELLHGMLMVLPQDEEEAPGAVHDFTR